MKHDLLERINGLIANAYIEDGVDADYQDSFANEGARKTAYVVDDLKYRESQGQIETNRLAYLCIGGADGSEVEHVLNETAISKAVMIEISADGSDAASKRAATLAQHNKDFVVLQGDATGLLDEAVSVAEGWCASGLVDGLVCSAQGVLHELPKRSDGFDLPIFLGKVFRNPNWRVCIFYSREPSLPVGWPEDVRIRIPELQAADLVRMARYVSDRLRMAGSPQALGSGWVDMPSMLAVETLHKLIRGGSIRRIGYELGEQLTSFDPMAVKNHLQSLVQGMHVSVEQVTTAGFKDALRDYKVDYVGHKSELLPVPRTHAEIIGYVCVDPPVPKLVEPLRHAKNPETVAPTAFRNPFGANITDSEIEAWLGQFEPDERPLIARLLDGFIYLNFNRTRSLAIELCDQLRLKLGDAFAKAWYLSMGGPAKSGGLVAYFYRTLNQISSDRFLSYMAVGEQVRAGDPVVMLDDLLASGHQALSEWKRDGNLFHGHPTFLATLVSCETGRTFVEERSELESISALHLNRSDEPLASTSTLFPDMAERDRLRNILEKYGRALSPTNPLGYSGSGLLLAFEHSTPDNSLPIFWAATAEWKPLLAKGSPARMETGVGDDSGDA